jgi:polyhydroxyalkanoate synthesis regulator phasin
LNIFSKEVHMIIAEIIKKAMLVGLGAQEKAKEFIEELVKAGELSKSEASTLVKEWTSKAEESTREFDKRVKETVANILEKLSIPNHEDMEKLEKKVQALNTRLKKLEGGASEE